MMRIRLAIMLAGLLAVGAVAAGPVDDHMEFRGFYVPNFFAELQEICLANGRAYVFGVGGMSVMNIDDPESLTLIGRYEPSGHPFTRYYRGVAGESWIYAAGREHGVHVIDVSNEAVPIARKFLGTVGYSYEGVALRGDLLIAARHKQGLELFDVTDPENAFAITEFFELDDCWDLAIEGDLAFVAAGDQGLAVVDLTIPAQPTLVVKLPVVGSAVDIAISGSIACIATGSAGVEIVSIADPSAPVLLARFNTEGIAVQVEIDGDRLYIADWKGVEVLDISDPANPTHVGSEDTPIRAMGLAAGDDRVYVADWSRVRVYDFQPSVAPDIDLDVAGVVFLGVEFAEEADTTFMIRNTGGSLLNISEINSFNIHFTILTETPLSIPPGGEAPLTIHFNRRNPGFSGTFVEMLSDDPDEGRISFPVTSAGSQDVEIGDLAPAFTLFDVDGYSQSLSDYLGTTVLLSFFATW